MKPKMGMFCVDFGSICAEFASNVCGFAWNSCRKLSGNCVEKMFYDFRLRLGYPTLKWHRDTMENKQKNYRNTRFSIVLSVHFPSSIFCVYRGIFASHFLVGLGRKRRSFSLVFELHPKRKRLHERRNVGTL